MEQQQRAGANDDQPPGLRLGEQNQPPHAPEHDRVEQQYDDRAEQTPLLAEGGEDEVGLGFGQEAQVGLGALQPALPARAARADGDQRLVEVVADSARVDLGIEQHEHAVLLVVREHVGVPDGGDQP